MSDEKPIARLVLLGASNLARDFPTVLAVARETLAPTLGTGPLEVFTACGHGRSYGDWSRVFLVRGLPGITRCGLWETLINRPEPLPTFALLTDIGNDIAYGVEPAKIAGWIDLVLGCLSRLGARTAMTLLPLASLRRLSPAKLQILRFLFFPTHPTSHERVQRWTADLQDRLRDLAARYEVPALEPDPDWFGPDPIHYRRNARREAWRQVLGLWRERSTEQGGAEVASTGAVSRMSRLRWWTTTPERWSLAGMQRGRQQPAGRLDEGTTLWLY